MRVLKNYPMYFDINGDKVRLHNFKAKFTDKGIQKCADGDKIIIIKYGSNEGD